mmetsp:Transcript_7449/g.22626  ORF Transcript_7449/g.22626 Transcript_7449/m.22626 type:complete len:402 (+) Transcript_7449:604-1809(+)
MGGWRRRGAHTGGARGRHAARGQGSVRGAQRDHHGRHLRRGQGARRTRRGGPPRAAAGGRHQLHRRVRVQDGRVGRRCGHHRLAEGAQPTHGALLLLRERKGQGGRQGVAAEQGFLLVVRHGQDERRGQLPLHALHPVTVRPAQAAGPHAGRGHGWRHRAAREARRGHAARCQGLGTGAALRESALALQLTDGGQDARGHRFHRHGAFDVGQVQPQPWHGTGPGQGQGLPHWAPGRHERGHAARGTGWHRDGAHRRGRADRGGRRRGRGTRILPGDVGGHPFAPHFRVPGRLPHARYRLLKATAGERKCTCFGCRTPPRHQERRRGHVHIPGMLSERTKDPINYLCSALTGRCVRPPRSLASASAKTKRRRLVMNKECSACWHPSRRIWRTECGHARANVE